MIWRSPHLYMWGMSDSDVSGGRKFNRRREPATVIRAYCPSGENWMSLTALWKLKWCKTIPFRAFTSRARPSDRGLISKSEFNQIRMWSRSPSSTDTSTFPSGLSAITAIFFRFSNAKVNDLLLQSTSQCEYLRKRMNTIVLTLRGRTQRRGFQQGYRASFHRGWTRCFLVYKLSHICWKTTGKISKILSANVENLPYLEVGLHLFIAQPHTIAEYSYTNTTK